MNKTWSGISRLVHQVADFFLPPRCASCAGKTDQHGHLCGPCWTGIDFISEPICVCCGFPFEVQMGDDQLCAACMADMPPFDWARSPLAYGDVSKQLILRYKHGGAAEMVPAFVRFMVRVMPEIQDIENVIFVPVPLHWKRLFTRRFNQSATLAKALAQEIGADYCPDLLSRRRHTKSQGGLGRLERARNVSGAFEITPSQKEKISKSMIILVDDVYTTGSTVKSCAKLLRKQGADSIGILTLSRVISPRYINNI